MDASRFDAVSRSLAENTPRRGMLAGFVGAGLGLVIGRRSQGVDAKNRGHNRRRRRRKRKNRRQDNQQPVINQFGCVDVGQLCFGRSDLCCSGICAGSPPKKGKPDERTCVAHDTGGCQGGQRPEGCGGVDIACTATSGIEGACNTTTGNAGLCAVSGDCFPCAKDADCQALCGSGAACIVCAETCAGTGGTACLGPSLCEGF